MALVNKQDSNFTDLRYAVETTPGVVDSSVVWRSFEPNSYKNFGASVKTKTRMPINASRQLKKGVVVDLDAQGGFIQDLTADNFTDVAQCFMYAALRTKSELTCAIVDGTGNDYEPASGGTGYAKDDLIFAKDFDELVNNGLKKVTTGGTNTSVPTTDTGLVNETGASGTISRVGFEFASGVASINATASAFPRLEVANVAASGDLVTDNTNAADGSTVIIGTKTYTFESSLTNVDGHIKIGGSADATLLNLARAINGTGGTPGTDYALANVAHTQVTSSASVTSHAITLTASTKGQAGNLIATTASTSPDSHIDPEGALLTGGVGRDLRTLGLIAGEPVYIGSDETNTSFTDEECNGFCRIYDIEADALVFDKTQFIMVDNAGSAKTIRLYFGRVCKNESDPQLQVRRGIQIERTLGAPDDALPAEIQAEYLVRSLANGLKVDFKTADIVRMEMDFLSNTSEFRTGAEGVKAGTRPDIDESDAFNTTSDVALTKVALVEDGDSCPTPLFSFFTDMTIDLKNNVKQNKAIKVLGAFDSTPGFFQVAVNLTAYFTDVAEMQAVIDNRSVTIETHMVKFNKGVSIDIPLVVLSDANADVKLNEAIMLPLKSDAAASAAVNANTDHTMLMAFWDYLPDVAG